MSDVRSYPPDRRILQQLPSLVMICGLGLGFGSTLAESGHRIWAIVLGVIGAAALVSLVNVVRFAFARVRVSDDAINLPRLLGPRTTVPLLKVAGLGMQYTTSGRASGWKPYVWPEEGERLRLNIAGPAAAAPPEHRPKHWLRDGVAPYLDWAYVAASPAGEALRELADHVRAVQGKYGIWESDHREQHRAYEKAADTAYWSPDGTIDLLPGARASD